VEATMKISEIMIRDVRTLLSDTPAQEAVQDIFKQEISGLPVVDKDGKVVGMFTEKDILRAILPGYVSQVGSFVYENSPKTIKCRVAKLLEYKVSDLMRRDVIKVLEETSVCEVARIMLTQNVRRVPVVDKNDKLVGIVSRTDVVGNIFKR
jgi:CBS domain-containing protein